MHAKPPRAATDNTASLPTVICHNLGSRLTGFLAHELATERFHIAIASDASAAADRSLDAVLLERDHFDPQGVIDDVRRYVPAAHIISIVTVGVVTIVHAFVSVPRAVDLERLRVLAAAVRRAARSAATAPATSCRPHDSASPSGRSGR
jgi:hypothetical protein